MSGPVQDSRREAGSTVERRAVSVRGIVQGVGFRPFVYSLAHQYGLAGTVRNDTQGVHVEIEGSPDRLDLFLRDIRDQAPPLAVVDTVRWTPIEMRGEREFRIEESREGIRRQALISPDSATCTECLRELFDPSNRRYRYPFINCTNCGPRFTITRSVPYDRAMTTMADFTMCPSCRREYDDPAHRRFHAQPNACPTCGPRVRLVDRTGHEVDSGQISSSNDPISAAAVLLRDGAIVAVKGLGGYHLACNPFDSGAVAALRSRKARQDKPFALMARDLSQVAALCYLGGEHEALLSSVERPIVLLERRDRNGIYPPLAEDVAPRQKNLGVMLAYTPLHHLLLHDADVPLVMTSGNRCDEPIAYRDESAFQHLGDIADYFLLHNRPIYMRCDDSVVRMIGGRATPIRRSRGCAPAPLRMASSFRRHTLACGGELKNTFCVAKDRYAFLSHHIGDLENYQTFRSYREGIEHYCSLFDIQPRLVAYDLHPEYLSTKYACELEEMGLQGCGIQHHDAHVASCLADNGCPADERVIGVALDGTGYGTDGAIWGGEFLHGSIREGFTRQAHLAYIPLPGGGTAIRQPWRMAVAQLVELYDEEAVLTLPLRVVRERGEHDVRSIAQLLHTRAGATWVAPPTSSAGRLFDTVAALCGLPGSWRTTYEGQAAIELELAACGATSRSYPFRIREEGETWVIETRDVLREVVEDLLAGTSVSEISTTFHRTMAEIVLTCCGRIRELTGLEAVALSGGTFQNALLTEQAADMLTESNFTVYCHGRVPPNDGGLALGQAVLADSLFEGTSD